MFFLIAVILATLSLASALPHLQRRGLPGAVYTCTSTNFRQNCQWSLPTDQCRQPGPKSLGVGIESLGPDPGGFCVLYEKFDCTGREIQTLRFPGLASGLPEFEAFRCLPDGDSMTSLGGGNATVAKATLKPIDPFADPRLAGGIGSLERKTYLEQIQRMEQDNFSEGFIGIKKGLYY